MYIFLPVVLLFVHVCSSVHSLSIPSTHPLYSAVNYFETLHKIDSVQHRVARDATLPRPTKDEPKIIQFNTLGRDFKLFLRPHTQPFHPHSHVQYGSEGGKVPIDVYQFHHGHVIGAESSHVIAHLTNSGVLTAVIMMDDDWYYIEPSGRHFSESHDFHMISYRGSDLKFNMTGKPNGKFCGASEPSDHQDNHRHDEHYSDSTKFAFHKTSSGIPSDDRHAHTGRLKRQSGTIEASSVCPVNLVATTSFYRHFGASNEDHTINFLLVVLLQVDTIFRSTNWVIEGASGSASPGVRGLQLAAVTVFNSTEDSPSYNADTDWSSDGLLRDFALSDWRDYCLAHLFTAQTFTDSSRLGVAYTAFADSLRAGGVCSRRTTFQNSPFSGNVGASTYRASDRFLVLAEAIVVTGHEFGHSWGSGHDPDTAQCSPPFGVNRGKYLMYAFAQDGQSRNNMIFSDCSRQAISQVINTHEGECFVAPSNDRCGDYTINEGEECDPGPSRVLQGGDDCCNADCTFKSSSNGTKYNCSDANHDCCFMCSPSPSGTVCREEDTGNVNCFANRTCNGGITCPEEAVYMQEGAPCGVMGVCMPSDDDVDVVTCTDFCELRNVTTCFCEGDDECMLCCENAATNMSCSPYTSPLLPLPAGRFCDGGTCDGQGTCVPSNPDLSTYLFELLTDFNTAAIVRFLRENIVGVVIFLSLVVWIPASIAVHLFDVHSERTRDKKKREREEKARLKKERRKNKMRKDEMAVPLTLDQDDVDSPPPSAALPPLAQPVFNEGKSMEFDNIRAHVRV